MERTVLPPACGEETQLPGVACVGCAAAVPYHQGRIDGFSVCVIASTDEVNLLGPDRSHGTGDEKLITRTLWRPPRHYSAGATAKMGISSGTPAVTRATRVNGSSDRHKTQPVPTAGPMSAVAASAGGGGGEASGNASSVKIVALLALLLNPDGTPRAAPSSSTAFDKARSEMSFACAVPDDTMCVFVAWADDRGRHHVSFLLVSLMSLLSPASATGTPLLFQELDALPLDADQRVLRLFYSHHIAEEMQHSEAAAAQPNPLHLILCSGYRLSTASGVAAGHGTSTSAARSGVDRTAEEPPCRTASGPTSKLNGFFTVWSISGFPGRADPWSGESSAGGGSAPVVAYLAPSGEWSKAAPSLSARSATLVSRPSLRLQQATAAEMPSWLRTFAPDRVVCCFDVMPHGADLTVASVGMRAAAGTTDGRVYVLTTHGQRLLRRLAGPIADAAFVVCDSLKKSAGDSSCAPNGGVVDQLLQEASAHRGGGDCRNISAGVQASPTSPTGLADVALVVLDSVGRVVYFLAINKNEVAASRVVCDVPQLIRLADRETNLLSFVEAPSPSASASGAAAGAAPRGVPQSASGTEKTGAAGGAAAGAASSRSFLDISTLRHFFGPRKQKEAVPVPALAGTQGLASEVASRGASGGPSPTLQGELMAGACAGHLLSRGLLRIAQLENVNGMPELVISTHGQLLVSIPYDQQEQRFYVAGFTITPSPMHYVQFVDIFGTGCEEIVFAGLDSVLVARRSRGTLRERALLLLRLVEQRRSHQYRLHTAVSAASADTLDA